MRSRLITACTALVCLLADQAGKAWARANLPLGSSQPFIPGVIQLTLATNTGGAFSLGHGNNGLMTGLVVAFITAIFIWVKTRERSASKPGPLERAGVGFLLGGAFGNLFDRLTQGQVTDFLDFAFISFPVFNIADVCIDIGLALIIASPYLEKHQGPDICSTGPQCPVESTGEEN